MSRKSPIDSLVLQLTKGYSHLSDKHTNKEIIVSLHEKDSDHISSQYTRYMFLHVAIGV